MASALSSNALLSASINCASSAAISNCSCLSRCLPDTLRGVGDIDVSGLDDVPDAAELSFAHHQALLQ